MYKKKATGWLKHWDFTLIDLIVVQISFIVALCCAGYLDLYNTLLYRNVAIILEIIDLVIILVFSSFRDVLKKGYYLTFVSCLKQGVLIGVTAILYLFAIQEGQHFSRLTIVYTSGIYILLSYICRELWKKHLFRYFATNNSNKQSLLIIADKQSAIQAIKKVNNQSFDNYSIVGLALFSDENIKNVENLEVVCNANEAPEYICNKWVDEVLIILPENKPYPSALINKLEETGVVVHVNIPYISSENGKKQFVEDIGGYTVLTTAFNYSSPKQLLVKRIMDIFAGIIGCLLTAIIFIFVAPIIYINSPGPIFYTQERIGRNGKPFKMYKFRSMYLDADERKAELMKENKIKDGRMFKMDFDPRIIGNKILLDGTKKTGIGEFIRKTSLDEFPQFYNVLKGDMSLVGTRPPLESEVNLYELHHHARLAVKPGITGMWQVSGRSNITDFEEVVKLDKEYINNWSIGLDIKIIFKTILVVFKKEGSM